MKSKFTPSIHRGWKREAVIQTGAFVTGIGVGAAIGLMIAFSPLGIVVGLVAAGAMAILADKGAQWFLGQAYDKFVP